MLEKKEMTLTATLQTPSMSPIMPQSPTITLLQRKTNRNYSWGVRAGEEESIIY